MVCLVTPTYTRDLKLCELLCESVDRYVTSFAKHVLVVPDSKLPLFAKSNGETRQVAATSEFLPTWLRPMLETFKRKGRQYWWSLRAKPVSGWHVEQLIKLAVVNILPYESYCLADSNIVFFRPINLSEFQRPRPVPLRYAPGAIRADAPLHARCVELAHSLLGLGEPKFPSDDFIGHVIFWDQSTARALLTQIERATGRNWVEALCKYLEFSEYISYGYYLRSSIPHLASHRLTTSPYLSYWGFDALDSEGMRNFIAVARDHHFAFSVSSISRTPIEIVRSALP